MKVLVVDDSGAMRKFIIKALSNYQGKMEFQEAEDGVRALYWVKMKKFDMILMDWNMPNMTGLEAVIKMRELGNTTPIIMATTNAEKSHILEALKSGANDYIVKPFNPGLLLDKFEKNLLANPPS